MHTNMHAHDHTGLWTATQPRQVPATQVTGCQAQASSARRGTPAARPHAWRGGRWVPPFLGNSSKFRPSLGHARLRNPAAQPVPATGGDPVPAELSPRAKPGPERVPGVPVTPGFPAPRGGHPAPHVLSLRIPWVCASSPARFVSLTHRPDAIPTSCPPRPARRIPGSRTCPHPSRSWTDPAPWVVALGRHAQCKSWAGMGNPSSL